jgi:hypothetical protein
MVIIFKVERPPAGKYLKRSALSAAIRIIGKFVVKLTSLLIVLLAIWVNKS